MVKKYQVLEEEIQNIRKIKPTVRNSKYVKDYWGTQTDRANLLEILLSLRTKCKRQKEFSKEEREAIYKVITLCLDEEEKFQRRINSELFAMKHSQTHRDWDNDWITSYKKCDDKDCPCQKMDEYNGCLNLW